MITYEKCPVCQTEGMKVEHGYKNPEDNFIHIEHCPECGTHYPVICYNCRHCEESSKLAFHPEPTPVSEMTLKGRDLNE